MSKLDEMYNNSLDNILAPTEIGKWQSYEPYTSEEQKEEQINGLITVPIRNAYGSIKFIFSTIIAKQEKLLKELSSEIKVINSKLSLETEVFFTSKIEGAKSSIIRTQQIHNGSPIDKSNEFSESMIKGSFSAVKLLNLYGGRISSKILKRVWEALTDNCRDNEEIIGTLYRSGPIGLSNNDFKAVNHLDIEEYMEEFISFYNGSLLDNYPFTKACIIHYAFETIHPFCDGNGRLGRLLLNNYLISRGIESTRAVSFSMQIDKSRGLYDGAFLLSENIYNDCTPIIEYLMEVFLKSFYVCKSED